MTPAPVSRLSPASVDPVRGPFLGRDWEIAALRAAMQQAWAAEARAVVLLGEPGIGKTRTAEELAQLARSEGALVLWGRCWEGAPAFWAWREAMRRIGDGEAGAVGSELLAAATRVIPEIRAGQRDAPESTALGAEPDREQGFASIAQLLFALAAERPLVLVLEDLQDADVASLLLLRSVLQQMRRSQARLFVLTTCRDSGQQGLFGVIPHEAFDAQIALRGLGPAAIGALLEATSGTMPSSELVASLQTMTNGNPLFLREVMHLWQCRGAPSPADFAARVPHHLRLILGERLRYLSADCRRLLSMAAVIGGDFDAQTLDAMAALRGDFPPVQVGDLLDEAARAQLISMTSVPDSYRFLHALIREFLYQALGGEERAQLHATLAAVLDKRSDRNELLAQLAYHFARATGDDAPEQAAAFSLLAAKRALASLAYEEAVRLCEGGLAALERGTGDTALRCDLLSTLGSAHKLCGALSSARQAFRDALQLAREQRAADLFGHAVLGYLWADNSSYATPEAWPLLQEALGLLPVDDSPLRAELLGTLANQALVARDQKAKERGAELGREALAMARRCGDVATLSRAVRDWYFTNYQPETMDERLAVTTELVEAGNRARELSIVLEGLRLRLPIQLEHGDRDAFDRDANDFARHAQQLRQPRWLWHVHLHECTAALLAGRFEEAESNADKMMRIAERGEEPEGLHVYLAFLFSVRVLQGRLHEIPEFEATGRNLIEQMPWNTAWRAGVLNGLVQIGRLDAARPGFDDMAAGDFSPLPRDSHLLTTVGFLAIVCSALGDKRRAAPLYEILLPFAGRNLIQSTLFPFLGPASRYLGMLALTMGRADDALRHFEDAESASKRLRSEPFEILARYGIAAALASRAAKDDWQRASVILGDSIARAAQLGLGLDLRAAEALRRRCLDPLDGSAETAEEFQSPTMDKAAKRFVLRLEGPYWVAGPMNDTLHLSDMRGLHYLVHLLSRPRQLVPSTKLAELAGAAGHASVRAGSNDSERLRSSVTKRLRGAITRIAEHWPEIGAHLSSSIRTGTVCSYQPPLSQTIDWMV